LAHGSLPFTGFGAAATDVELDGDLDLLVANGKVFRGTADPRARVREPWSHFAEPNLFYLNNGAGRFEQVDLAQALTRPVEVSRALSLGDIDTDGDLDVLLVNAQGPARLLRNDAPRSGHWLVVRAVDPRLKRDAIGARVTVVTAERRIVRTITRGSSYLSSNDPRAHFGLGPQPQIERIEVRWPGGPGESFDAPGVDRVLTLVRGEGSGG
jgi:hypothetical protein